MVSVIGSPRMSAQEYLAWERTQEEKHDWCDGEVFAMAGGTMRHAALTVPSASSSRARCAAARAACSRRI